MTDRTTFTETPNSTEYGLPPPEPDIEDYRADMGEFDLSPEQEEELLQILWHIVKMTVDAGFGLDAASMVLAEFQEKTKDGAQSCATTEGQANKDQGGNDD